MLYAGVRLDISGAGESDVGAAIPVDPHGGCEASDGEVGLIIEAILPPAATPPSARRRVRPPRRRGRPARRRGRPATAADGQRATPDDQRAAADGQLGLADGPRADADGQRGPADDPRADADGQRGPADDPRADADGQRGPADDPRADADGQRGPADDPRADADCQRGPADEPRADADSQRAATKEPRATTDGQRAAVDAPAPTWTAGAQPRLICPPGYTLRSVVFQEEGGLQPIAPSAPTGPPPDEPGPEPESPGDPPSFAPDVNNPQSVETAIRAYRNTLNDHLRRQLRYEDDKRAYDEAAARHRDYHAQLTTYTTRLASYTSDIAAWRIADRRALAILLATIPSSLKRELSPTSSSHLWQLLVDLFDRQDIATLYALIKDFGSITMDSTAGAAAFTRRVLDLARRLAALGVTYPDTVICCHLLEGLTPAFDAHKLAYMQLLSKHDTLAQVAQWIITTEAEILRHSSSTAAVAQQRSGKGGRGGGRGAATVSRLDRWECSLCGPPLRSLPCAVHRW
ncbi:unnamed protein product [Closterium sp. NIES-65]|nr:unnamed protein product [Closterium sp. NIES-65]